MLVEYGVWIFIPASGHKQGYPNEN